MVNVCDDDRWCGGTWSHTITPPHSHASWHFYRWQLYFCHPVFHPSLESIDCLRICDEQAGEENIHLDPKQEGPLLERWEGHLQDQQDGNDGDYAEGEDDVEVGEGDGVGDGPPGPPAQYTLDREGPEGHCDRLGGDDDQGSGEAKKEVGDLSENRTLALTREDRNQLRILAWKIHRGSW